MFNLTHHQLDLLLSVSNNLVLTWQQVKLSNYGGSVNYPTTFEQFVRTFCLHLVLGDGDSTAALRVKNPSLTTANIYSSISYTVLDIYVHSIGV